MRGKRSAVIAAFTAVLALGITLGVYQASTPEKVSIPDSVCNGTLKGEQFRDFFPREGEKFTEEEHTRSRFGWADDNFSSASCVLRVGDNDVWLEYIYNAGNKYPREDMQKRGEPTEWGEDYGAYRNGAFFMYVACPGSVNAQGKILVKVGASSAEADERDVGKVVPQLASLTASVVRTLVTEMFECRSVDSLPEGPVEFSDGRP
ncbi:hypothetical protein [Streptomyces sp. WMMC897]|uniref:hypothetical protein n=1 Tax=Streptomyces sp. WMMC897 TaxID=3014782 RepID=UPI0022B6BEA8|nr:hypothetical protein [Streptomyces sp. WMMC897]MCZ7415229.1 hypothetical protein [Streptomyces sp. WMMC897]